MSCLIFVRNYWGAGPLHGWYTGHFWSLAVEEQFYLFWPALLFMAGFRRARWMAPALAVGFAVWRSLDMHHAWIANLFHNEMLRNDPLRSDYRMDYLLWGSTLALLSQGRDLKQFVTRYAASVLAVSAVAAAVALNVVKPKGYFIAQALLFPLALLATVAQPQAGLGRLLESAPLRWIGRLSYSLYLWQQLFFHSGYTHGVLQRLPLNLALALSCAWLSYRFVEQPAIKLGRTLLEPRRQFARAAVI